MHTVEKILNNTTPYGKIRASHEGSLHSSTLMEMEKSSSQYCRLSDVLYIAATVTILEKTHTIAASLTEIQI